MNDFVELAEEEWFDAFKPLPNHIDKNAAFNDGEKGYLFETYGTELEFVKVQDPNRIWTYTERDDGGTYISSGWQMVNRLGYFISTVPFDDNKDYQVQVSSGDSYECPNCNEIWEEEDAILNYEKFEDLGKCIGCASKEELKERKVDLEQ